MSPALESARTLAMTGRGAEARATLESILANDPAHAGALVLLGEIALQDREPGRALDLLERASGLVPDSAEAHNLVARALHALGRNQEALAAARHAHGLLADPAHFRQAAPVYLTIVWCLRDLGRLPEALAAAEEGLVRAPDAVLAEWAGVVELELAASEQERC